jgi:hypothetical protein
MSVHIKFYNGQIMEIEGEEVEAHITYRAMLDGHVLWENVCYRTPREAADSARRERAARLGQRACECGRVIKEN